MARLVVLLTCVTSLGACNVPMTLGPLSGAPVPRKGYMNAAGLGFVAMSQRPESPGTLQSAEVHFNLAT